MKILVAYVPVLHRGYEEFFLRHSDADRLVLFDIPTISNFEWLRKDLRSISPSRIREAILSWGLFKEVSLFEELSPSVFEGSFVVMPDETECRILAENRFKGVHVVFESVHLRYDKKKTESTDSVVAPEITWPEAVSFMNMAEGLRSKSYDWWIQVVAMAVKDGKVLIAAWNEHKPSEREALFMGDPRSNYGRGINIELSLADHAESVVIGEAARLGIPLLDSDLYVTTFPCPPCARLIVRSGVRRLFFDRGYSMLDGDKTLRDAKVELYRVKR